MLTNQLFLGFWFYLIFSFFAGIGLLVTLRIFPDSKPLAYFLAKPLGLAAFGYVIWLLASLKIISYQDNIFVGGLFIAAVLAGLFYAGKIIYKSTNKEQRKILYKNVLWLELCSLVLYFGYLYLRSFNAAAYGTERFMDMALLNSSLKASHFPFVDPWYAGKSVNYYYYGHYLVSVLTKLSNISSFLTYSFALGLLYTAAFMLAGFFVYEITKSKPFAVLGGFLVTTAGSLFYSGCVLSTWMRGQAICSYASSTRLYTPSYIINEIPSYSFTVGDLHAHFMALPFFIVNLILIYALFKRRSPDKFLGLALLVSLTTSALVNPSDVTTLGLLLTILWLYFMYGIYKKSASLMDAVRSKEARPWWYLALWLCLGTLVLYSPFLLNFKSPVLGFGFVPTFAMAHHFWLNGYQVPTPFLAELGMWGAYIITIGGIIYFLRKRLDGIIFPILMSAAAVFLIIFVELFYVKDIYHIANPPYFRANTVFKYGYHTWILLSLAFPVCLASAFAALKQSKRYKKVLPTLKWLLAIFIFFGLFYPYQAIEQFYLSSPATPNTLDASAFMASQSVDDLNTVNYINQNIKTRSVVLEAVGDSYSYFARMSVFTGMITPMGWKTHEWTWRFDGAQAEKILAKNPNANVETGYGPIAKVAQDVQTIYQTPYINQAEQLLKQYGVQYVYIGNLERTTYPGLQEQKFYSLGKVIFQSGSSQLFKLN